MSCGLGAVILIFLILRHGESNSPEENSRILDDIEMAKASMHETKIKISNESQKIIFDEDKMWVYFERHV